MQRKFIYPSIASKTMPVVNGEYADRNACSVFAIAHAFNLEFTDAQAICAKWGREHGKGMLVEHMCMMLAVEFAGRNKPVGVFGTTGCADIALTYLREAYGSYAQLLPGMTLDRCVRTYNVWTYIVYIKGHVTVVKDGSILSYNRENGNKRVCAVWKVE